MSDTKIRLEVIRNRINEIDEQIIELMAERTHFAKEIALLKKALDMPIYNNKREQEIYEKTRKLCEKYDFDHNVALQIMDILIKHNKELQMKEFNKL